MPNIAPLKKGCKNYLSVCRDSKGFFIARVALKNTKQNNATVFMILNCRNDE